MRALSLRDPYTFWGEAAKNITWITEPRSVLEIGKHGYGKWFQGGQLNTCYNCVDRHVVQGHGDRTALIYDSPVTDTIKKFTYSELLEQVCRTATVLKELGVGKGDRVIIYMPNIPEAAISMLACARIGAIHSVVFGGFAAPELSTRIKDCKPKLIIAASCGIDGKKLIDYKTLLDEAIKLSDPVHKVEKTLILQRPQLPVNLVPNRDYNFRELVDKVDEYDPSYATMDASDPLYILYTSGTTGAPKGIVRENAGHAVALRWSMENIYNMGPEDVFWAASDVGWVVGHSYIVYGPLLRGCTTIMYEGKPVGTPDESNFWRTIERHKVNCLFTAPTALRAIKRRDHHGENTKNFNMKSFRELFLAGEHADPESIKWSEHTLNAPVLDHWWQTETGWAICANAVGMEGYIPVKYGSTFKPCPGYNVQILDSDNKPVGPNTTGKLAIKLPLPPGAMLSLHNAEDRFFNSYLKAIPGYYDTGDSGYIDDDGYVYVMSRTDDVINVAGHRLSSGAMEEVISEHPDVGEVAVVGKKDSFKGQIPIALIVLNTELEHQLDQIKQEVIQLVRQKIGPVASFKDVIIVKHLPKTRSGKVLRATLRLIADGKTDYPVPATIEDPNVLKDIANILHNYKAESSN